MADDLILPFQVGETAVRGRVVRLGPAIDTILRKHPFPAGLNELVGEAAALVALMGSALKFDGKLIFQAQGDGPAPMLVADYSASGALRATGKLAAEAGDMGGARGLAAIVGKGHMALTVDQGPDMERYQGVTALDGGSLSAVAVAYFDQSEQIPTAIKLAVGRVARPGAGEVWRAGGVIAQFMPGEGGGRLRGEAVLKGPEDEEIWNRAAILLESTQADELLDPGLSAEALLWRLYHEDGVRVFEPHSVRAECACNADKIAAILERYGPDELTEMLENGFIRANCDFCRTEYLFDREGRRVAS